MIRGLSPDWRRRRRTARRALRLGLFLRGLATLRATLAASLLLAACTPSPAASPPPPSAEPTRSARLLVSDNALWAAHPASRTVTRLALPSGNQVWQRPLGCEPATLARASGRLFVTCFDSGEVIALDEERGAIVKRRWVGRGPFGLLATTSGTYVTLADDGALAVLEPSTLRERKRVATGRQPRGLALKGARLYVVHLLDASVLVYDSGTLAPLGSMEPGLQAATAESVAVSATGDRAYVPHQRLNVTNMARQFDNTVFPVVSAFDTNEMRPVRRETLALDSVDTPVSMPAAVGLSADGSRLFVVNAVSDDLSVVNLATGVGAGHVVLGSSPRDLALSPDGKRLYTLNLVSDDITVIDAEALTVLGTLPLAADTRPAQVQRGERLFNTSRPDSIARDNWMACASCHLDAGFDGQTWLGTDGGPRNTPTLRGIADTFPLHWSADRPDVQSFQQTFTTLMAGTGLSDADLNALAAYLTSLKPQPSPLRQRDGSLSQQATRGAALFQQGQCSVCHTPALFTDRQLHAVGTGEPLYPNPTGPGTVPETAGPAFDTPSLRELWLTAPYLHDGRAPTLRDLLTTFNRGDRHGETSTLSRDELSALEAFLLSLPLTGDEVRTLFRR
ncbi:MAG: c-type cytochrome [Dehalococcoidia bacterium]|nr:c-type cytochrome [Dehalococcoidia bacterium]